MNVLLLFFFRICVAILSISFNIYYVNIVIYLKQMEYCRVIQIDIFYFNDCESSLDSLEAHQALLVQLHLAGFGLGYLAKGSGHHEILVVKHGPMPTGYHYIS